VVDLVLVELLPLLMVVLVVQAVHQLTVAQAAQLLHQVKVMLEQHLVSHTDHQVVVAVHRRQVQELQIKTVVLVVTEHLILIPAAQ
jgi:hypothetical protein